MKELEIGQLLSELSAILGRYQVNFWPGYLAQLEEQLGRAYALDPWAKGQ